MRSKSASLSQFASDIRNLAERLATLKGQLNRAYDDFENAKAHMKAQAWSDCSEALQEAMEKAWDAQDATNNAADILEAALGRKQDEV